MDSFKLQKCKRFLKVLRRNRPNNKIWCVTMLQQMRNFASNKSRSKVPASSREDKVRGLVSVLLPLACVIGCTVHIWYISDLYFLYDTTTLVTLASDWIFELPAITVCMGLLGSFYKEKWAHRFGKEEMDYGEWIHAGLTIEEIIDFGADMERDGIIVRKDISAPPSTELLHHWDSYKSIHAPFGLRCETFLLKAKHNTNISYTSQTLIQLQFRYFGNDYVRLAGKSMYNDYRVYVHPSSEKVDILRDQQKFINVWEDHVIEAQLSTPTRSLLLPAPYKSDCLNYAGRMAFIVNRADCIQNCRLKAYKDFLGSNEWNIEHSIFLSDVRYNWTSLRLVTLEHGQRVAVDERASECQRMECSKPDCVQNYIGLSLIQDKVFRVNHSFSVLLLRFPNEPSRSYTSKGKIEFVEYLCYIGGVLSLWLGISAIGSISYIQKGFQKFYRPKSRVDVFSVKTA